MATTHLAQKLYDKTKLDAGVWRADLRSWVAKSAEYGFRYRGSSETALWEMARQHLRHKIPDYCDWIDKEARRVSPSKLRVDSVEQCTGAVISYSRQIRAMTMEMHARLAKLERPVDLGHWEDVDEKAILARGNFLLRSLGLDVRRSIPSRLNHVVADNPWFFAALSVISILISMASFFVAMR